MRRRHEELQRTRREHRFHLRWVHNWPRDAVECACELQAGRFRKKKALDCGNTRCGLCHYDKVFGVASFRERLLHLRADDSLADFLEENCDEMSEMLSPGD